MSNSINELIEILKSMLWNFIAADNEFYCHYQCLTILIKKQCIYQVLMLTVVCAGLWNTSLLTPLHFSPFVPIIPSAHCFPRLPRTSPSLPSFSGFTKWLKAMPMVSSLSQLQTKMLFGTHISFLHEHNFYLS